MNRFGICPGKRPLSVDKPYATGTDVTSRLMQWTPMRSAYPANVRQTAQSLWTIIQLPYGSPSDWL